VSSVEQRLVERIAAMADACLACGQPHACRVKSEGWARWTWADPGDGHAYRRAMPSDVADWLRGPVLAALAEKVGAVDSD
jgi:hypothetical protein